MGLDPSLRNWGIVECSAPLDTGILKVDRISTIHTKPMPKTSRVSKSTWDIQSANQLYTGVAATVEDADIVCVEVPYGSQDAKSALGRGICLGILGSLLDDRFIFVTPQSLKKIVGSKDASKKEMVSWATKSHPEASWPRHNGNISVTKAEHAADALVAIYAAAQTKDFVSLIDRYRNNTK